VFRLVCLICCHSASRSDYAYLAVNGLRRLEYALLTFIEREMASTFSVSFLAEISPLVLLYLGSDFLHLSLVRVFQSFYFLSLLLSNLVSIRLL